jgi:predicted Kef-type K+ transport protein
MLELLGMLFVVCGAFGMTDLAGVRPASGFWMLARILCHIHVSDESSDTVFGSPVPWSGGC